MTKRPVPARGELETLLAHNPYLGPDLVAAWEAWCADRLERTRAALLLVSSCQHLRAQRPSVPAQLREFSAALCAHLDIPFTLPRRPSSMADQPTNEPTARYADRIGALSGDELATMLIRCGVPLPVVREKLLAQADALERALYAARRLRTACGEDPAELRVSLAELRDQVEAIAAADAELAAWIA